MHNVTTAFLQIPEVQAAIANFEAEAAEVLSKCRSQEDIGKAESIIGLRMQQIAISNQTILLRVTNEIDFPLRPSLRWAAMKQMKI